jgi:transcription elongation factor Elf1
MSKEIKHDYTDEIVCPWCGYRHSDSWETDPGLQECENCGKSFYAERNVEVTYSTQKAKYGTCKHCGKEDVPIQNCYGNIVCYKSLCPVCGEKERIRQLDEYQFRLERD